MLRDEGSIYYNGKNHIKTDSIIENICMVDNNPFIFSNTLRYNLAFASPGVSDEELNEKLKVVGLYDYFKNQKGLDTVIESEGSNLSGGQLSKLKSDMTIILITHRLRNTEIADYIYFLKDKKVIEEGSFEEMKEKKNFGALYNSQMDLEMWGVA